MDLPLEEALIELAISHRSGPWRVGVSERLLELGQIRDLGLEPDPLDIMGLDDGSPPKTRAGITPKGQEALRVAGSFIPPSEGQYRVWGRSYRTDWDDPWWQKAKVLEAESFEGAIQQASLMWTSTAGMTIAYLNPNDVAIPVLFWTWKQGVFFPTDEYVSLQHCNNLRRRFPARRGQFRSSALVGPRESPLGYIYVIQADQGPVKVGWSKTPKRRLGALQTGSPKALHLRHVCKARRACEREVHDTLKESRLQGEWFEVSPEEALKAIEGVLADGATISVDLV